MNKKFILSIIILIALTLQGLIPLCIPVSSSTVFRYTSQTQAENLPSISEFVSKITSNSSSGSLSGIYVENILADRIVQQREGNPGYVSNEPETVTQFSMASQFGTIGILAHNTAAGAAFFDLETDDVIYLVHSSGELQSFIVTEIQEYRAIKPNSPYSDFSDLSDPSTLISAQTLFMRTYGRGGVLVLQTCINKAGDPSWGRFFVIAQPVSILPNTSSRPINVQVFSYGQLILLK